MVGYSCQSAPLYALHLSEVGESTSQFDQVKMSMSLNERWGMQFHPEPAWEHRSMPVTMKQLAADVGVSIVTVSKVLHNNSDISKKTRDLVLQRARELGMVGGLLSC